MSAVERLRHLQSVPTPPRAQCEVCFNEPAITVAASGIADEPVAFGKRCIEEGAEPIRLVAPYANTAVTGKQIDGTQRWFLDGIKVYVTTAEVYMTVREWVAAGRPGREASGKA